MDFDKFRKELNFISSNADIMKQTVIDWANINSGSKHLAGLAIMHQTLLTAFSCLGGTIQTIPSNPFEVVNKEGELTLQKTGALLVIEKRWESAQNRILLCGHMDTVFDKTDPFQAVIETEDNVLNGPGVADMKGGLVVMLYALKAFEQSPEAKNIGWKVVINADEEIGSLGSNAFLKKCAHEASLGLVYEPSMTPEGLFAGERKGSGKFSIVVTGIAAHAGRDFYQGRNAISHLSSLICEIQKLNDPKESLTINIGLISGGVALNVVPNKAVTHIDVRFKNPSDKKFFLNKLNELIDNYNNAEGFSVKTNLVESVNNASTTERLTAIGSRLTDSIDTSDNSILVSNRYITKYLFEGDDNWSTQRIFLKATLGNDCLTFSASYKNCSIYDFNIFFLTPDKEDLIGFKMGGYNGTSETTNAKIILNNDDG